MPSKPNQYMPGVRLSNTAKTSARSTMAPGASQPPMGIDIGIGEPVMLPRKTLAAPVAFPTQQPAPVAFPTQQPAPMAFPTQPAQPVAPVTRARPMQQAQPAQALPFPTAAVQPVQMPTTAQPMYAVDLGDGTTLEMGSQPGSPDIVLDDPSFYIATPTSPMEEAPLEMGDFALPKQGAGEGIGSHKQADLPEYSADRAKAEKTINESYNAALQKALDERSQYFGRLGLSGSGLEQAAMFDITAQMERDRSSALSQVGMEYENMIQRERMARDAWERMEPLFRAQVTNELLSGLIGAGADAMEVFNLSQGQVADLYAKIHAGMDPTQALESIKITVLQPEDRTTNLGSESSDKDKQRLEEYRRRQAQNFGYSWGH